MHETRGGSDGLSEAVLGEQLQVLVPQAVWPDVDAEETAQGEEAVQVGEAVGGHGDGCVLADCSCRIN